MLEDEELSRRFAALIARLPECPEVTIEYFVPDDRKAGSWYAAVTDPER